MDHLNEALNRSLASEGGFSNNAKDSGGRTNWGITEALARRYHYTGRMEDLDRRTAISIHIEEFWRPLQCAAIADIAPTIAYEVFDTGMNCGPDRAATFLQRALNVLNREAKDYPDVEVDGDIGPQTLAALRAFAARRGPAGILALFRLLNCLQGAFYASLCEVREKDEEFMFGWLTHRVQ